MRPEETRAPSDHGGRHRVDASGGSAEPVALNEGFTAGSVTAMRAPRGRSSPKEKRPGSPTCTIARLPRRRPGPMSWWSALSLLAAFRVAIPLLAYAGTGLPGTPEFTRSPVDGGLKGEATGFYSAEREFMAAWGRMPWPIIVLALVFAAGSLVLVWRLLRRPWWPAVALFCFGLLVCCGIHWMRPSGAAVFGWPLVWSLAMLPFRPFGLTKAVAWDVGVGLSLAFVALTVFAVGYLGRNATGRRWVGVLAAAFWTFWPLLVGVIAGHDAWRNDQWNIDVGLHNYSEPLSTLLVTAGAALLLSPQLTEMRLVLGGCALSVSTSVKVSNGLLAAAALVIVWLRGRAGEALPYLAVALSFAPVVLVYWPLSYPKLFDNPKSWPRDPFDAGHVVTSWTHSSMFDPRTLAIITPLAVVGAWGVRRPWALTLVVAFILVNAVFYSFYANTALHPRFLYTTLPELFVLWAAGAAVVTRAVRR